MSCLPRAVGSVPGALHPDGPRWPGLASWTQCPHWTATKEIVNMDVDKCIDSNGADRTGSRLCNVVLPKRHEVSMNEKEDAGHAAEEIVA